ncbi:uncharacterized protein MAM_01786 [Metarhizium album ARSEF 1941]|uniref:Wax synthase domain-containing protein n=1 Tax=Metarhizium album (strain ARSEF 1941) TaxID=1081103 RepID=A0A0B2X2A7_METAS|nr:uncharacterized protein MAM_01786 [Metarhizium album ARSEF 1941]KHN99862.1 hypothetical protein MAM_01786 [Metarhizium album ARSEF 1941]
MDRLGEAVRTSYRTAFLDALNEGRAKPLIIPYSILGAPVIPTLWLTIPHTSRPWLYQTRWLVMAFVTCFNVHVTRTASSTNFACARPQFEAARVIKVEAGAKKAGKSENGDWKTVTEIVHEDVLRQRKHNMDAVLHDKRDEANNENEYMWQTFPEKGTFLDRLGWALDLSLSFRGAGWNYSIASIPRPHIPRPIQPDSPVITASITAKTASGYTVPLSETELLASRLTGIASCYLILDFLSVQMMKDPYFILGPHMSQPQSHLILVYRECMSMVGIWAAINALFSLSDLAQYYFLKTFFPSRAALWHYASTFGSLAEIFNRGLAGWWGAWWHQTFRLEFLGPSTYLLQNGYIKRDSKVADAVGLFSSFFQSGLMHAAGSVSSIPDTKPWRPIVFFLLQSVGIALQQRLALFLRSGLGTAPRIIRQLGNVLFCLAWLYMTAPFFIDDMASTGLWMLEPVPISPLRCMGFGHPADRCWRWDRHHLPKWYKAKHWWEIGIAL